MINKAVHTSLEEYIGNIFSNSNKLDATSKNCSQLSYSPVTDYHLNNTYYLIHHIEMYLNSFHLNSIIPKQRITDIIHNLGRSDKIGDAFLSNVIVAMAAQRIGNHDLAIEFCNKANEGRELLLTSTKDKDKLGIGSSLLGFFCCMEGDSQSASKFLFRMFTCYSDAYLLWIGGSGRSFYGYSFKPL